MRGEKLERRECAVSSKKNSFDNSIGRTSTYRPKGHGQHHRGLLVPALPAHHRLLHAAAPRRHQQLHGRVLGAGSGGNGRIPQQGVQRAPGRPDQPAAAAAARGGGAQHVDGEDGARVDGGVGGVGGEEDRLVPVGVVPRPYRRGRGLRRRRTPRSLPDSLWGCPAGGRGPVKERECSDGAQ